MMKVLNVNMTLDPVEGGGTAERTYQMSRSLAKAGANCTILTTNLGLTSQRVKNLEGVTVVALPCLVKRFYFPKFSYRQIEKLVTEADIIHLMGHWTFINALVYKVAHRLNKPYVVCPAGALPIYGRSKLIKRLYNWIVGHRLIRQASGHIAVTSAEIPHFQAYGVEADKVSVIPNGINREDYLANNAREFRQKYCLPEAPFLLFVGRLNPIKGPDLLLHAFGQVKDDFPAYHLVLAGPDEGMLNELKQIAVQNRIEERVHFVGYTGGLDKSQAYHAAELLVIPSRQEAMSIVVLEAGVTGKPVLLTDQCGFNQIAAVGGGQVVPASVEGLRQGLVELLGNPAQLKCKGANLQKFTFENFMWDSVVNKYLILYDKITRLDQVQP